MFNQLFNAQLRDPISVTSPCIFSYSLQNLALMAIKIIIGITVGTSATMAQSTASESLQIFQTHRPITFIVEKQSAVAQVGKGKRGFV